MLNLKDFYYLSRIEELIHALIYDRPGLIVVAGLEPRRVAVERTGERWMNSGRTAILRVLMREFLTAHPNSNCLIVTANGSPYRPPREFRTRIRHLSTSSKDITTRLSMAVASDQPDLFVFEEFEPESVGVIYDAVRKGGRVLTQIDTVFRGTGVLRYLWSLGLTNEQARMVSWVVSVQRVPTLCPDCKQAYVLAALQMQQLGLSELDGERICFRAGGCDACHNSGHSGEVTVFDFFRSDSETQYLFEQVSILPERDYLNGLVLQGQISVEDAENFESKLLHDTYTILAAGEKALVEANTALKSKILELEVSNRILLQRTEALISLQDISQTLTKTSGLQDLANRVCRHVLDLCGADRVVVYYKRSEDHVEVLAYDGWTVLAVSQQLDMTYFPGMGTTSEPCAFSQMPPGILVKMDKEQKLSRAGLNVPLVAQERLVGVMIVH